jgi:hypothetical protein
MHVLRTTCWVNSVHYTSQDIMHMHQEQEIEKKITHPTRRNQRFSKNRVTISSSSIEHVSLVEYCLGIDNVNIVYLFPFYNPHPLHAGSHRRKNQRPPSIRFPQ